MGAFENNGYGVTIGFRPWSYSQTTVQFGFKEYTYHTGGRGGSGGIQTNWSKWTFGGWISKVGCNDCEPNDLNEWFVNGDLVLGLGAGIAPRKSDLVEDSRVQRSRRLSLTFRRIII